MIFFKTISILVLGLIVAGCGLIVPGVDKRENLREAWLGWYVYYSDDEALRTAQLQAYLEQINLYLDAHPEINVDDAKKMRDCFVTLGMDKDSVVAMAPPHKVLEKAQSTVYEYSNIGSIPTFYKKTVGTGTRVSVRIKNGKVVKIDQLDSHMGF